MRWTKSREDTREFSPLSFPLTLYLSLSPQTPNSVLLTSPNTPALRFSAALKWPRMPLGHPQSSTTWWVFFLDPQHKQQDTLDRFFVSHNTTIRLPQTQDSPEVETSLSIHMFFLLSILSTLSAVHKIAEGCVAWAAMLCCDCLPPYS